MPKSTRSTTEVKDALHSLVVSMLSDPRNTTAEEFRAVTIGTKYLEICVKLEDNYGSGFAEALAGPGEDEFDPPTAEGGPSVLTQLGEEQPDGRP